MLFDEDRLRHHGSHAAGTKEPGERCDEMNEKNKQIAHLLIVTNLESHGVVPRINNSPGTRPISFQPLCRCHLLSLVQVSGSLLGAVTDRAAEQISPSNLAGWEIKEIIGRRSNVYDYRKTVL